MISESGGDGLQLNLVSSYPASHSSKSILIPEETTHHWPHQGSVALRIERRGSRVSAAYRVGDQDWVKLPNWMSVRWWGNSCDVGVAAINTATAPFTAEFRNFQVVKGLD